MLQGILLPLAMAVFCAGEPAQAPQALFHAPFDGTAEASSGGSPSPLKAINLKYAPGVKGEAVDITSASLLEYSTKGNLKQERGTVCLWFKPHWAPSQIPSDSNALTVSHCLFSEPFPLANDGAPGADPRHGSGALWLWFWGPRLRADLSDAKDHFKTVNAYLKNKDVWVHMAFSWDAEKGSEIYVDGKRMESASGKFLGDPDNAEDFSALLKNKPSSFFAGSQGERMKADGLLDEFKIYDRPLSSEEVVADMAQIAPLEIEIARRCIAEGPDRSLSWAVKNLLGVKLGGKLEWRIEASNGEILAQGEEGSFALRAGAKKDFESKLTKLSKGTVTLFVKCDGALERRADIDVLGTSNQSLAAAGALKTTPLETIDFAKGVSADRFVSAGECAKGELGGRGYLEAGRKLFSRFAVKATLPQANVPYLVEWDYPDDKKRTMEMCVNDALAPDYTLQTGVMCGDEFPVSMKTLTHSSIFWPKTKDMALIFMTCEENAPAAVSEIRIAKIEGGLPDAGIVDAKPLDGWNRSLGVYFEDFSGIDNEFGVSGRLMPDYEESVDRLVAYMKFSGQNLLVYPELFYQGRVGSTYFHEPDYIEVLLAKFKANGLCFMPSFNFHGRMPEGLRVDEKSFNDGSLNSSPLSIQANGKPNAKGGHGTPPAFNPLHPYVKAYVEGIVDELLEKHGDNPAFKGVVLHLTKHTCLWFGDLDSGYNDYAVEAFEKETGVETGVDRSSPLRGKLRHDWLMANAKERWIEWRCEKLAAWYKDIARRLSEKRPDLKLEICSYNPTMTDHESDKRFSEPGFALELSKESGVDPELYKDCDNIILSQTIYPADYRWFAMHRRSEENRKPIRNDIFKAGLYETLKDASRPWVNIHDRYWECSIGRRSPLAAKWLKETDWRVSTLNPGGDFFLQQYIVPLKYGDVLGFTKGGFLIGTCGGEKKLVEFARAFRALPAVKFSDVPGSTEQVKVRAFRGEGALWVYAVNAGFEPVDVTLPVDGLVDLSNGSKPERGVVRLEPFQLRSFKGAADAKLKKAECSEPR